MYFADTENHCIRRIDLTANTVSTVAGTCGSKGYQGDGYIASSNLVRLNFPSGVALSPFSVSGTEYPGFTIADRDNHLIRSVEEGKSGLIRTISGLAGEIGGYNGDGFDALSAQLNAPWNVMYALNKAVVPNVYVLYVTDSINNRIRMLTPMSAGYSRITTVVGGGKVSYYY